MQLRYEIASCPYGQLLLACSESGIAALFLADSRAELLAEFEHAFPNSEKQLCSGMAELEVVQQLLKAPNMAVTVNLDLQGTAFQQQVWQALLGIAAGQTISYKQLAEQLGKPKAYRAVANACGANKIAILIPCHRVIASNGATTGYRWGVQRKEKILKYEQYCLQNEQ